MRQFVYARGGGYLVILVPYSELEPGTTLKHMRSLCSKRIVGKSDRLKDVRALMHVDSGTVVYPHRVRDEFVSKGMVQALYMANGYEYPAEVEHLVSYRYERVQPSILFRVYAPGMDPIAVGAAIVALQR